MRRLTFLNIVIVTSYVLSLIIEIAGFECIPSEEELCPTQSDCDNYCKADGNCDKYWPSNPEDNEKWRTCVRAKLYCECPNHLPAAAIIGIIGITGAIIAVLLLVCICKCRNSKTICPTTAIYATRQTSSSPIYIGNQDEYLQQTNLNLQLDYPPPFPIDNDLPTYEQATGTDYKES